MGDPDIRSELSPNTMSRRRLLGLTSAFFASTGFTGCANFSCIDRKETNLVLLDAHSHLFNVSDLPTKGFISNVIIRDPENNFGGLTQEALILLAGIIIDVAGLLGGISARRELEQISAENSKTGLRSQQTTTNLTEVETARKSLLGKTFLTAAELDNAFDNLVDERLKLLQDLEQREPQIKLLPKRLNTQEIDSGRRSLLGQIQRELGPTSPAIRKLDLLKSNEDQTPSLLPGGSLLKRQRTSITRSLRENAQEKSDLVKRVKGKGDPSLFSKLGMLFSWARLLHDSRVSITDRYLTLYGRQDSRGGVAFAAPALIDYDYWVQDCPKSEASSLDQQVKLHGELSKRYSDKIAIHGYVPFDPLRQIRLDRGISDRPNSRSRGPDTATTCPDLGKELAGIALLEEAISEHGFLGAKLYPPMGFRAAGNKLLPNSDFPQWTQKGLNPDETIGDVLDSTLYDFYRKCVELDIPILAHSAASIGSDGGVSPMRTSLRNGRHPCFQAAN